MSHDAAHLEDYATRLRPRQASNLLLWGIFLFFVTVVLWASFATLDRSVAAAGRVIPSSRLQVISNLEGGIVEAILVRAGEEVAADAALIRLDQTQVGAELSSNRTALAAQGARIARLQSEVQGGTPSFPAPGSPVEAEQIAIERALHASRLADLASLSSAGAARIRQAERAVAEAQASYQSRVTQRDSAQNQLQLIRPLVERGIEPRMTLIQLENSASVAASDAAAAAQSIARAQAGVAEARAALAQVRQDWRAQAAAELAATQGEAAARREALPALSDRVRRTTVAAPVAGRINRVLVSTVGGTVAAGQPLIELVPSRDAVVVEAMVMPRDIGFVRLGQRASINVSAYDSAIYGAVDGRVATISPDATVDERTGESFYLVRVEADASTLRDGSGRALEIGPGMTAEVRLLGDRRSVMSYVLTPITRLGERAFRE